MSVSPHVSGTCCALCHLVSPASLSPHVCVTFLLPGQGAQFRPIRQRHALPTAGGAHTANGAHGADSAGSIGSAETVPRQC